nr:MAG TPA: hypothetical protein [Caudoviricetes sp.]
MPLYIFLGYVFMRFDGANIVNQSVSHTKSPLNLPSKRDF